MSLPPNSPVYLNETASQTAGPYVHIGLAPKQAGFDIFENNFGNVLVNAKTKGERIHIKGRVIDGSNAVIKDVLLEIWQANAAGRYNHPADRQESKPIDKNFRGWGRACTDFESGIYAFDTIKPGSVTGRDGKPMAPHISVWLAARGINIGLATRIYFSDEEKANAADPVLNSIEWVDRRKTLIAQRSEKNGKVIYTFDVHLQGPDETVFFDN
ncbi:MAG: protocatechuate 3,4-dioxygenase subunit alpha [Burkholderiaceae bacterium]|nr:MAG: protocatechuate 3,4-dioxygenase subunit alpha [Burkholderiaceae bacterium]TAM08940.1 MAG: protocatechuate 3,4-dioxygenase subunit alpha [Pusillimonas sp.]